MGKCRECLRIRVRRERTPERVGVVVGRKELPARVS